MKKCVDSSPIPVMQEAWLHSIRKKIAPHLQEGREDVVQAILKEIQNNFNDSMKKSLVQLSLKKPSVRGLEDDDLIPLVEEPT